VAHITKKFHKLEELIVLPLFFPWIIVYSLCLRFNNLNFVKFVPNIISVSRMIFAPISAFLLYHQFISQSILSFLVWLWFFGFLAYGDRVDGMISRNCDAISDAGKMIDAGSDKIFFVAHMVPIFIGLNKLEPDFYYGVLLTTFIFLVIAEFILVFLAVEGFLLKKKGYIIVLGANNFGKYKFNAEIATFVFSLVLLFANKIYNLEIENYIFYIIQFLLVISILLAFLSIYNHIRKNISAVKESR